MKLVMCRIHGVLEDVDYMKHFYLRLFHDLTFGALENFDLLFGAEPTC